MHLLEAATLASESAADDGTWKVRLISEGKGSSGTYPKELLENHHHALDNLLSFKNHPTGWDGPQERDFTMIAGEIKGETWVDTDERGLTAVYGNFLPDPEYADKLARYKEKLGLSIYIEGTGYWRENSEGGEDFIVDWFNPNDPYASVDVVIAPGARGKFMESMKKVYSDRTENKSPGSRQAENKKEIKLEKEELEAALKPLADAISALVADKKTAEAAEAQVKADEAAVTTAVEAYEVAVKAIDDAKLLPVQVESLRKAAKVPGADITSLIEEAKQVKDQLTAELEESAKETSEHGLVLGSRKVESAVDLGKVF